MITATSTEQRTDSSCAFLNRPPLRLRKVLVYVVVSFVFMGRRLDGYIHGTISIILNRFNLNLSATHHELLGACVVSIYIYFQDALSLSFSGLSQTTEGSVQSSGGKSGVEQNNGLKTAAGPEAAIEGRETFEDSDGLYSRASSAERRSAAGMLVDDVIWRCRSRS